MRHYVTAFRHMPLAFGSGISILPRDGDLLITAVNIRLKRVTLLGECMIENYRARPTADLNREYTAFVRRLQLNHLAALVILPRESVTARVLSFPELNRKDLRSAIELQIDSLHSYPVDDVHSAWSKLRRNDYLIAVTRTSAVKELHHLFTAAGISISGFTIAASALFNAVRLGDQHPLEFGGFEENGSTVELYGESESRALFSACIDKPTPNFENQLRSQLRLDDAHEIRPLTQYLPSSGSVTPLTSIGYAAALCAASSLVSRPVNLLPTSSRASNSQLRYLPTAALATCLLLCAIFLFIQKTQQQQAYQAQLNRIIHGLQPQAEQTQKLVKQTVAYRAKLEQIDAFRNQSKHDLDAVDELTRVLPEAAYLTSLDLNRKDLTASGQAKAAAGLLQQIDSSPLFQGSTFANEIARVPNGELFRVRAARRDEP